MEDKFKIALKNDIIPVVTIDDVNNASPLAEALIEDVQNLSDARMAKRTDHSMSATLLDSQFQTLEEPVDAIVASIDQTPRANCKVIITEVLVGGGR